MKRYVPWILMLGLSLVAASSSWARKWTDTSGHYSVEAELVEVKEGKAWLKKTDGKVVGVPVAKLSQSDRDYLESIEKNRADAERNKLARAEAISAILKLGGAYATDSESPQRPLIAVFLSKPEFTDDGLKHLRGQNRLELLSLQHTHVTDAGLEHLKGMTRLQKLDLGSTKIFGAGLQYLKGLTSLQKLCISRTHVTDAGVAHLKGMTSLQELNLCGTKVSDAGLKHLKGLPGLRSLYLDETAVTDAGLKHLQGLTSLEALYLSGTQVGDAGLQHLQEISDLEVLDLHNARVTDAGLEHLHGLTKLEVLDLRGTRVTDGGVKKCQQVLPDCKVEHLSVFAVAAPEVLSSRPTEFPVRTWHDDRGKYQIEAAFVELKGEKAYLRTADGETVGVPVLELRIEDRRVVAQSVVERATAALRTRQLDKPLAELNDLLQLNPSSCSPAYFTRAKVWILRKDFPRALADLDKAIETTSSDVPKIYFYVFRSSVHWIQGNRESAAADYDKAMTLTASTKDIERRPEWGVPGEHPTDLQNAGQTEGRDPFFGVPSSLPRKPPFEITISRETTRIHGPLREAGWVDYVAALDDRCRQGVTPENNAVIPLLQAVGPQDFYEDDCEQFCKSIGTPTLPEQGPYFETLEDYIESRASEEPVAGESDTPRDPWEKYEAALRRPWARKDYPLLSDWIRANDQPIRRVIEASRRPHYYAPLVFEGADAPLFASLLPLESDVREASRLLVARAMLRLGAGNGSEARQDLLACHRLSRLVGQGPTLFQALVGFSISSLACAGEMALAHDGKLSASQARQHAADLDKISPRPDVSDKIDVCERWANLDVAVRIATGGAGAFHDMQTMLRTVFADADEAHPLGETNPLDKTWLYNETLDWDELLRITNVVYDRMVAAMRHAKRADRVRALDEFDKQIEAVTKRIKVNLTGPRIMSLTCGVVPPEVKAEHLAEVFLSLSLPSAKLVVNAEDTQTVRWQQCRIAYALAGYRADHGGYPERLSQLSPKYIDNIPIDLFTGEQLRYTRVANDEYRLYSLGPNGKDDGGKDDDVAVSDSK